MTSKNFTVKYRRKREKKTDYKLRRKLLKSELPRLVVRKSLRKFTVQVIDYVQDGDKILASANGKDFINISWKYSEANFPSAYLIGLVCGMKAKSKSVKKVVVDFGLNRVISGSKLYAAVKGFIDGGVEVLCAEKVLPKDDVCAGKRIGEYAKLLLKEDKARYDKQFSAYIKSGVKPEAIEEAFAKAKKEIQDKKW